MMGGQGSNEDRKYGLEPGEFERISKVHKETYDGIDYVSDSLTKEERSKSRSALSGAVKWDDKSYVELRYQKDSRSSSESVWGQRERANFRIPFLFPFCGVGLGVYALIHFSRDGLGMSSIGLYAAVALPVLLCSWLMSRKGDGFGIGLALAVMFGGAAWAVLHFQHVNDPIRGNGSTAESSGLYVPKWVPPPKKQTPQEKKKQDEMITRQNEALRRSYAGQARRSSR